jgi:WD40 repeat protein
MVKKVNEFAKPHEGRVWCLEFSHDDSILASGSWGTDR